MAKYQDFKLLVDGKQAFPSIIKEIENASKSIFINMFIWRDDVIGNKIVQACLNAANRGVKITILIPDKANYQNDSNHKTVKR